MTEPTYASDQYVLHSISPYLSVRGAAAAVEFYRTLFGAEVLSRMERNGVVFHAELKIGNTVMMLGENTARTPKESVGVVSLGYYVPDVDAFYKRALELGSCAQDQPEDQFWGDRMGSFVDPYGVRWGVSQRLKNMTQAELDQGLIDKMSQERAVLEAKREAMMQQRQAAEQCYLGKSK